LIGSSLKRCLHLGAESLAFGQRATEQGLISEYVAVGQNQLDQIPSRTSGENIRWCPSLDAIGPGRFDLVLSTGFFSSGAAVPPIGTLLDRTAGALVLVERFQHADDRAGERLLAAYLDQAASSLPPGWTSRRTDSDARPAALIDPLFFEHFDCFEVRPFGGTLVEPLFDRLPADFFGLGAFTMLGAISGAFMLLEETLIATRLLPSRFNVVVATPRGAAGMDLSHTPTGWSVDADRTFDRLKAGNVTPAAAIDRARLAGALDRAIRSADTLITTGAGGSAAKVRDFLRRGLLRLSNRSEH
jgi:hypothetical protein